LWLFQEKLPDITNPEGNAAGVKIFKERERILPGSSQDITELSHGHAVMDVEMSF
jgi:hypothetical protein